MTLSPMVPDRTGGVRIRGLTLLVVVRPLPMASRLVGAEVIGVNSALPGLDEVQGTTHLETAANGVQELKDGCSIEASTDTSFPGSAFCSRLFLESGDGVCGEGRIKEGKVVEKWALVSTLKFCSALLGPFSTAPQTCHRHQPSKAGPPGAHCC